MFASNLTDSSGWRNKNSLAQSDPGQLFLTFFTLFPTFVRLSFMISFKIVLS